MRYVRTLFLDSAILIVFIFVANSLAMRFSWYFYYWWFDMPMHFLGGAWVALTALVLAMRADSSRETTRSVLWLCLVAGLATLSIGLLWEAFEFGIEELVRFSTNSLVDTASDLVFDMAGAFAGVAYFIFRHKPRDRARP